MGIESNKEAMAMMKRALQSMEGKIREAYNKGNFTLLVDANGNPLLYNEP